jgi:hypothetical protein
VAHHRHNIVEREEGVALDFRVHVLAHGTAGQQLHLHHQCQRSIKTLVFISAAKNWHNSFLSASFLDADLNGSAFNWSPGSAFGMRIRIREV